ncbi:Acriflavin resistance protein [Nitrospirillum viridazoti Y2]|uniref:Efflux pump membrane transporter n=1 Tax=Nitrospirillum amazonense TaxID=28077 RepID=A0A560II26_9PROT|nr:efflux RND transporter permease subunit [Nitrospirillum amazonense]EGY00472.1 Acriflavin resistance protein [Nitrospirillum amazonense Y2]TWB58646.1 multidrug efflux pump [Nitrospirillum amazonense]
MFARYFIDRPIFAWVIAIVIMLFGVLAIFTLPISQYPDIAPPSVSISASYPGASAEAVESSVVQVLEQQLTGIDHLLYFSSSSSSNGSASISVTFEQGTNPDVAQVQVQNKVSQATSRLPTQVQQQGITVAKAQTDFLMVVAVYDETDKASSADVADFLVSNLQDPLSRVNGVGTTRVFGSQYAMRIWLDPHKLHSYGLMPSDIESAIQAQNTQVTAGEIGARPSADTQQLNATVTAMSRLQTPDQFRKIIVKTLTNGATVHLSDVARVELGNEDYSVSTRLNGHPASGMALQLASGANAMTTAAAVKAKVEAMAHNFPAGYKIAYPRDSTAFVKLSIHEVIKTLIEAIILVVIVMFVFLQSWRAVLVPAIAVPVVLLGTFGVLSAAGYSINTLTLFAMVLAIGLLVDDAIVVVENVERIMREEKLSAYEATAKSMTEITGALVGIAMVLSAVFLPMAFFGGSVGVIYRQFSITIVSAMALSVVVALVLSPALCATLLKANGHAHTKGLAGWFNRNFDRGQEGYARRLGGIVGRPVIFMLTYGVIVGAMALLFVRLPTSFLPDEDQGSVMVQYTLPVGATYARTDQVSRAIEKYFLENESGTVRALFTVAGFSFAGSGQNAGMAFLALKDWSDRPGAEHRAQAIAARATKSLSSIRDAQIFSLIPPSIQGLGQSNGFDMWLQDNGTLGHAGLMGARNQLLGLAAREKTLQAVRPNGLDDTPQLKIDIDHAKATALGLSIGDITSTLSGAWGANYVNDFIDRGRVKRVYVQADAPYRSAPEDLGAWYVTGSNGTMAPFTAFAQARWEMGPPQLQRFNGLAALEIQGAAAGETSSGDAMNTMEKLAAQLPPGTSLSWTGLSYQERLSSGQAPMLYALSILVVFLCLAALYESWSIPVSVLLVIPLGVLGAVTAATLRGLSNDIYFQVGLLTTIGLSAKNAILIVEFAEAAEKRGVPTVQAAIEGARLRLRPILMTSLAFVAGVLPLALATGAGAGSQNDIGTGVVGGVISATILAIFFVPLFYVLVRKLFGGDLAGKHGAPPRNDLADDLHSEGV